MQPILDMNGGGLPIIATIVYCDHCLLRSSSVLEVKDSTELFSFDNYVPLSRFIVLNHFDFAYKAGTPVTFCHSPEVSGLVRCGVSQSAGTFFIR